MERFSSCKHLGCTLPHWGVGVERGGDIGKDFKKIIWENPTILMLVEVAYGKTKKSIT